MKKNNIKIGKWGEDQACLFLVKRGFSILARNKGYKSGELDILALKDKTLLVVEVKTSVVKHGAAASEDFRPELRVSSQKRLKIRKALGEYLGEIRNNPEINIKPDFKAISYAVIAVQVCRATKSGRIRFIHDLVF